jgi:hypothetical protein
MRDAPVQRAGLVEDLLCGVCSLRRAEVLAVVERVDGVQNSLYINKHPHGHTHMHTYTDTHPLTHTHTHSHTCARI